MRQGGASGPAKLWQLRTILALDLAIHVLQTAWSSPALRSKNGICCSAWERARGRWTRCGSAPRIPTAAPGSASARPRFRRSLGACKNSARKLPTGRRSSSPAAA